MENVKKEKKKQIITMSYSLFNRVLGALLISIMWLTTQSPWWINSSIGMLKLLCVDIVYISIYHVFEKLYKANKLGAFSITEIIYSQILSFGFANSILYFEYSIYYHRIINPIPILLVLLIEVGLEVLIVLYFHRLYMRFEEPKNVIIIYKSNDYLFFKDKMIEKINIYNRYKIIDCVIESEVDSILDNLDNIDQIYLYNVSAEIRNKIMFVGEKNKIDIYITRSIPDILSMSFEVSHAFDTPFIRTKRQNNNKWYYLFLKRLFDIVCSLIALIVLSPIFIIVAILIKLTDNGPVFYKQIRLTKNHKKFKIYKFRSMIVNAEENGVARLSSKNDSRITPIGNLIRKTRIDELPQLINILKGDMSIVGPRPERPEIEEEYLKTLPEFSLRLKVKAGLTGYAQIFGKYNTTPLDKLKLDLIYINQQSIIFDLKMILLTFKIIFIPESTEGIKEGTTTALIQNDNTNFN